MMGALEFFDIISLIGKDNPEVRGEATGNTIISAANAQEIYPEFFCPCCGQPLDPSNICCGSMKQRIDYIDTQVEAGLSKDEVMVNAVKEFGIDSLVEETTKEEITEKLIALAPADAPEIVFEQENYNFGEVSQADGIVFAYLNFKNEGKGNLIIDKLDSSCGCTSASIVYKGTEGPLFTMAGHGKENPKDWQVSIAPGEIAQLKIYYDPNAHGEQEEDVLSITRTVTVFSNDPIEFGKQVKIELDQIP